MTAKQKAARERFKKVVAEAGKLRKKNPKLTQAQAVKQAFAMQKKVGAIKIIEKGETKSSKVKATYQQVRSKKGTFKGLKKVGALPKKKASASKRITDIHKDSKSHNVNIRVVSGMPIGQGDYLVSTWGYDQTNVDFYFVTKVSKGSAYIIPASQKVVEYGDMQGKVVPKEPNFNVTPVRRKIKKYSGGEYISLNTFSIARKWEGNPVFYSSYA
jgi:hypothetical protein